MPDFHNQRLYATTPAQIFACLRDPERLARWWGPAGFTNTFETFQFSPGGAWIFTMHGPDGKDYPNRSVFRAIEPDSRVVVEHDCEPHFTLEIRLTPQGPATLLEWIMDFRDPDFARNLHDFLQTANEQNLDRLGQELMHAA